MSSSRAKIVIEAAAGQKDNDPCIHKLWMENSPGVCISILWEGLLADGKKQVIVCRKENCYINKLYVTPICCSFDL
jgi:hypothetical protein